MKIHLKQWHEERRSVIAISLLTAICLLGDSVLYVTLPIYYREVGLHSLWEVGLLLSVNRLVRIPLNPITVWVYRHIPVRVGMWIALVLSMFSTIGYGFANGLIAWLLLRVIWGCAWSLLRLGGVMILVQLGDDQTHGEKMGLYNGLYRLGTLVGMLLGPILTYGIGFSYTVFCFGILPIFALLWHKAFLIHSLEHEGLGKKEVTRFHFSPRQWLILITGFLLSFYIQGVITSSVSYFVELRYPIGLEVGGWIIPTVILGGLISGLRWIWEPMVAITSGKWFDLYGRKKSLIGLLLLFAILFLLIPVPDLRWSWIVVVLSLLFLSTLLSTCSDAMMSESAKPPSAKWFSSLYTLFADLGAALGPLWAYLWLNQSWGSWFIATVGSCSLLMLALLWLVRFKEREVSQEMLRT